MQFPEYLSHLRHEAKLTNEQLARKASVPRSLIAGLQSGRRRVGEYAAGKIGVALGLSGEQLIDFIYRAVDTCTEKVLKDSQAYPAELLNLLARQLRGIGIYGSDVEQYKVQGDNQRKTVALYLKNGRKAQIATEVALN